MDTKDAYITQLENTIKNLEHQVSNLTEMLILLRKRKFSSLSEKTPRAETPGQLSLFNEAGVEENPTIDEPLKKRVDGYYRKNPRTKCEELIKDLPIREVLCDILEEDRCCVQ